MIGSTQNDSRVLAAVSPGNLGAADGEGINRPGAREHGHSLPAVKYAGNQAFYPYSILHTAPYGIWNMECNPYGT
ncbi:putative protein in type-1 retrotransposable element R1DM [Fusarium oxysporum f. sp. albedinis]|nr:putative protein in type-1 retrotransposable element R1DM [Fusarium oxysporum f. sp. albedinis]